MTEIQREWIERQDIRIDSEGYVAKGVIFFPPVWPKGSNLKVGPGDMDRFLHYDGLLNLFDHTKGTVCDDVLHPHHLSHGRGLLAYFGQNDPSFIGNLLDFCRINGNLFEYAAFVRESSKPRQEGFLRQVRLVSRAALRHIFCIKEMDINGSKAELDEFSFGQSVNLEDALLSFVASEEIRWYNNKDLECCLSDKRLGSKEMPKELVFGLMVEDRRFAVLRIWSMVELANPMF